MIRFDKIFLCTLILRPRPDSLVVSLFSHAVGCSCVPGLVIQRIILKMVQTASLLDTQALG